MDITEILDAKEPRIAPVEFILDATIERALADAEAEVAAARNRIDMPTRYPNAQRDLTAALAALDQARTAAAAVTATFTFQALGREQFSELRGQHPPTREQRQEWKALFLKQGMAEHQIPELEHNTKTFPPVLIAASCIDPVMTVEQAQALWTSPKFSDAELAELFGAALLVNQQHRRHDLGNAFR